MSKGDAMSTNDPGIVLREAQENYRDELVRAGLLIPMGSAGLMGRNAVFEDIVSALGNSVNALAADENETHWHFPPVVPRSLVHRVGYMRSFPDLLGSIHAFTGSDSDQKLILDAVESHGAEQRSGLSYRRALLPA
jgi:hypothetical protein